MPNAHRSESFHIERFDKKRHERSNFDCRNAALDAYLKTRATQDERGYSTVLYVAHAADDPAELKRIVGYYTLSTGALQLSALGADDRKGLPKYPHVPVMHLGRMAVDKDFQSKGIGCRLLFHCLYRARSVIGKIGWTGMEVYAKNDEAKSFYKKYGFKQLEDDEFHLFLPINVIQSMAPEEPDPITES